MEAVSKRKSGFKAAVIGTGDLKRETVGLIKEKQCGHCIDYLGYIENPYPYMKAAKVLLLTSRWEGVPMVCLEALALGKPIVSTPVDGVQGIVSDGKNGFLRNEDKGLIESLLNIIGDGGLYKYMSENAQKSSDRINNREIYKEKILECYKNCLEEWEE